MSKKETKEMGVSDLPGVGAATAEKLKDAGYDSLMAIAVSTPGELVEAAGVGEAVARKIINAARNNMNMGFETGEELLKKRELVGRISTGSNMLNALVGGGFETGGICETYGAFGCGKTSIAHQLAVSVQLPPEKGGLNGVAVWIDTESTFRPERVVQIANAMGLDPMETLRNIRCVRAYNSDHQMIIAEKVEDLIIKEGLPVKLVVVDSLTAHFRAEFVGRGTLADRQQKLNKHMHILMKLADMHALCVYVTNQVMVKPDVFFGDPTVAIGGNIVGHNSQTRLYLRRGKAGSRVAKLVDSPHLPDGEAIFEITEEGIMDSK
ncbi:MAG: DNA repair and recombination protein RadA [Candidatus Woesearchaeota archaeon]